MRRTALFDGVRLAAAALLIGSGTVARATGASTQPNETPETQPQDTAQAQESASPPPATVEQAASKKWEFATIGYIWFAGAWGKTDVIGPVAPVDLDLPFGKVLKGFKFAFMGAAEA